MCSSSCVSVHCARTNNEKCPAHWLIKSKYQAYLTNTVMSNSLLFITSIGLRGFTYYFPLPLHVFFSSGRLLIKRNVLPHLLGLKISLISIIPIIFAIIFIITKKAMILSKLALLVTSFVGFSSIAKVQYCVKGVSYWCLVCAESILFLFRTIVLQAQ